MKKMTEWTLMWKELVKIGSQRRKLKGQSDTWYGRAEDFQTRVINRWKKGMDSSRQFILETLEKYPNATVLDIGAGTGDWALLMAEKAASVTALDSSDAMLSVLRERIKQDGINNVFPVQGVWPDADLGKFDLCFCSHAVYGSEDIESFITKLNRTAKKRVILLVRAPQLDAVMGQASQIVLGHPYDSPNYQILINILFSMGIYPNVIMEDRGLWKPWICSSFEEALTGVKQRLGVFESDQVDQELIKLLQENLTETKEGVVWPRGVRTALLYWDHESDNL